MVARGDRGTREPPVLRWARFAPAEAGERFRDIWADHVAKSHVLAPLPGRMVLMREDPGVPLCCTPGYHLTTLRVVGTLLYRAR